MPNTGALQAMFSANHTTSPTASTPPGASANPNAPTPPGGANTSAGVQQIIPDAGVYGQETNAANAAYQTAVTNALASRNALYNQFGLTNTGQVDPNNPYGQYQQMLSQEASQLTADQNNAAGRNLGIGGLANQQVSADKNQQAFQNFAFQNQVAGNESNYQQALSNALDSKNSSISQAYSDALNTALQNMIYNMESGNYSSGGGDNSGGSSGGANGGGNKSTPTVKDTSDALSRYLKNNAPVKAKYRGGGGGSTKAS